MNKTSWSTLLAGAIMATGATAQAQTPPSSDEPLPANERSVSPPAGAADQDRDHDYGWIGLIGLAGLLGLARRKKHVEKRDEQRAAFTQQPVPGGGRY